MVVHIVAHILISGQSGWRRSRETVARSKYHWTAIAQLLHGGWPASHCDVGNSRSHVAPTPVFPHQNQLKEKLLLFLKKREWLFVFSSLNGEISTGRMCRKFTGCQISSLPWTKQQKNKIYQTFVNIRDQLLNRCKWLELGSTVLLQCSPSPEIPRRALNTTRYIAHTICLPSTLCSIVGQRVIVINGQSPWQQWVISLVWWLWWWWRFLLQENALL